MKKVILSLVFVFTFTLTNAKKDEIKTKENNVESKDYESCLIRAYRWTNYMESLTIAGERSWNIEQWSGVFQSMFECYYRLYLK